MYSQIDAIKISQCRFERETVGSFRICKMEEDDLKSTPFGFGLTQDYCLKGLLVLFKQLPPKENKQVQNQ